MFDAPRRGKYRFDIESGRMQPLSLWEQRELANVRYRKQNDPACYCPGGIGEEHVCDRTLTLASKRCCRIEQVGCPECIAVIAINEILWLFFADEEQRSRRYPHRIGKANHDHSSYRPWP